MSAACTGAVNVYQSFGGQPVGWYALCGTSEATPLFAGIVALADQVAGHPLGLINPALYKLGSEHAPGIVSVGSGNNTVAFRQGGRAHQVGGFGARSGYNLAAGQFDQTRLGIGYVDDCVLLSFNYYSYFTYTGIPALVQNNSYVLQLSLRTLGPDYLSAVGLGN